MRTAIATDSNSGITQEQAEKLGIYVLPMPFMINGEMFYEGVNLTHEEFFRQMEEGADITTSQPSPGEVTDFWDKLLKEYDEILYIPMSGGLSGSCQTAIMLSDDYDGKVQVVNNQRISVTQEQSALDARDLAAKGYEAAQIKEILERVKYESSIYITLTTLKYLKKGGRITPAAAALGTLLRIKPVLTIQGERHVLQSRQGPLCSQPLLRIWMSVSMTRMQNILTWRLPIPAMKKMQKSWKQL